MTVLLLALAGALGAAARHLVDGAVTRVVASAAAPRALGGFPLGILLINVSGSVLLGALAGGQVAGRVDDAVVLLAGGGFLGAYTTFSTFTSQTLRLAEDGAWVPVALNLLLSGPLCFAGAGAAYWAAR